MGKGIIIILYFFGPVTILLFLVGIIFRQKVILKSIVLIWILIIGLMLLAALAEYINTPKRVKESDLFGEYVIDKTKFGGKQADWQYENYKFEIKPNRTLIFSQLQNNGRFKSEIVNVKIYDDGVRSYLNILSTKKNSHVIQQSPTLFRKRFCFYYVFHSKKFGNMFFEKGTWKSK